MKTNKSVKQNSKIGTNTKISVSNKELTEELSRLKLEKAFLKRQLDVVYQDKSNTEKIFFKIAITERKIEQVKFKIRIVKELRKKEREGRK